ncbi:hypothetical protein Btru_005481 [Bulinus truncatus]|nr:hypothetical protein Btru_005481 [Bulinus truncatus]
MLSMVIGADLIMDASKSSRGASRGLFRKSASTDSGGSFDTVDGCPEHERSDRRAPEELTTPLVDCGGPHLRVRLADAGEMVKSSLDSGVSFDMDPTTPSPGDGVSVQPAFTGPERERPPPDDSVSAATANIGSAPSTSCPHPIRSHTDVSSIFSKIARGKRKVQPEGENDACDRSRRPTGDKLKSSSFGERAEGAELHPRDPIESRPGQIEEDVNFSQVNSKGSSPGTVEESINVHQCNSHSSLLNRIEEHTDLCPDSSTECPLDKLEGHAVLNEYKPSNCTVEEDIDLYRKKPKESNLIIEEDIDLYQDQPKEAFLDVIIEDQDESKSDVSDLGEDATGPATQECPGVIPSIGRPRSISDVVCPSRGLNQIMNINPRCLQVCDDVDNFHLPLIVDPVWSQHNGHAVNGLSSNLMTNSLLQHDLLPVAIIEKELSHENDSVKKGLNFPGLVDECLQVLSDFSLPFYLKESPADEGAEAARLSSIHSPGDDCGMCCYPPTDAPVVSSMDDSTSNISCDMDNSHWFRCETALQREISLLHEKRSSRVTSPAPAVSAWSHSSTDVTEFHLMQDGPLLSPNKSEMSVESGQAHSPVRVKRDFGAWRLLSSLDDGFDLSQLSLGTAPTDIANGDDVKFDDHTGLEHTSQLNSQPEFIASDSDNFPALEGLDLTEVRERSYSESRGKLSLISPPALSGNSITPSVEMSASSSSIPSIPTSLSRSLELNLISSVTFSSSSTDLSSLVTPHAKVSAKCTRWQGLKTAILRLSSPTKNFQRPSIFNSTKCSYDLTHASNRSLESSSPPKERKRKKSQQPLLSTSSPATPSSPPMPYKLPALSHSDRHAAHFLANRARSHSVDDIFNSRSYDRHRPSVSVKTRDLLTSPQNAPVHNQLFGGDTPCVCRGDALLDSVYDTQKAEKNKLVHSQDGSTVKEIKKAQQFGLSLQDLKKEKYEENNSSSN